LARNRLYHELETGEPIKTLVAPQGTNGSSETNLVRWCGFVSCGGFHLREKFVEGLTGEVMAVGDDGGDLLRVRDVLDGIGVEKDDVGELVWFDGAELIFEVKEVSGI
jgi:hypothetical protein